MAPNVTGAEAGPRPPTNSDCKQPWKRRKITQELSFPVPEFELNIMIKKARMEPQPPF